MILNRRGHGVEHNGRSGCLLWSGRSVVSMDTALVTADLRNLKSVGLMLEFNLSDLESSFDLTLQLGELAYFGS